MAIGTGNEAATEDQAGHGTRASDKPISTRPPSRSSEYCRYARHHYPCCECSRNESSPPRLESTERTSTRERLRLSHVTFRCLLYSKSPGVGHSDPVPIRKIAHCGAPLRLSEL